MRSNANLVSIACKIFGKDNVLTDKEQITPYCFGNSPLAKRTVCVITPCSSDHLCKFLEKTSDIDFKIVTVGGGTIFIRDVIPPTSDTVIISTEKLKNNPHIEPASMTVSTDSGLKVSDLSEFLLQYGLELVVRPFLPNSKTIGGSIAENTNGYGSFTGGSVGDSLNYVELCLSTGEKLSVSKSMVERNILNLIPGSFGNFGIITKLKIKIRRHPELKYSIAFLFKRRETPIRILHSCLVNEIRVSTAEILDSKLISMLDKTTRILPINQKYRNILLMQFSGSKSSVAKSVKQVKRIADSMEREYVLKENANYLFKFREGVLTLVRYNLSPSIVLKLQPYSERITELTYLLSSLESELNSPLAFFGDIYNSPKIVLQAKGDSEEIVAILNTLVSKLTGLGFTPIDVFSLGFKCCPPWMKNFLNREMLSLYEKLKKVFDPINRFHCLVF